MLLNRNIFKKLFACLLIIGLAGAYILFPTPVHAQTDSYSANVTFDSSCDGSVNGQSTAVDYDALNGDTINISITNSSSDTLVVTSKGATPVTVAPSASSSTSVSVNGQAEVNFGCQSGSGNPGILYIDGASGNLGCSVSDGKVWNVTGQYYDVAPELYMYRGSTYIASIPTTSGSPSGGNVYVDEQFAANSTAVTYYLYDGTSSSDLLIGQATCPAIQTAAASTSAPKDSTNTSSASSASSTSSTKPSTSTKATTPSPSKSLSNDVNLYAINSSATSKYNYTYLYVVLGLFGLIAIVTIVGTWKTFTKAGRHGWAAIIPVYNSWVIYEMGDKPGWWALISLIPVVNIAALVVAILALIKIGEKFGKGLWFSIFGLILFGFVGWPMLGFGKAKHNAKEAPVSEPSDTKKKDKS